MKVDTKVSTVAETEFYIIDRQISILVEVDVTENDK